MVPFFHPTTVVIVDDEPLFLKSFEYGYGDQFLCHMERSAEQALQVLEGSNHDLCRHIVCRRPSSEQGEFSASQELHMPKLRTSDIARTLQDDRRFAMVSVVIVDYVMPSMNGIDFCRRIRDLPAKKVLLTGRAGDRTAVEAFNEGLIDRFLVKHDSEINTKLPDIIRRLQLQFFEDARQHWNGLENGPLPSFLEQGLVVKEINTLLQLHQACEYYVSFEPNGVTFANENGKIGFICVVDDEERRAQREIAEAANAPDALISELARDEVNARFPTMLGYFDKSCHATWQQYLHPAKLIDTSSGRWGLSVLFDENLANLLPKQVRGLTRYRSSINHPAT